MRWTKGGACASVVVGFETNYAWLIPIMSWWIKKIAASASLTSWIPTSFNVWPSSQQRGTSTIDMLSIINAIVGHCRFNPTYSRLLHPVSRPPSHSRRANDRSISSVVIAPPVFAARSVMGLVALYESDWTSFLVSQSSRSHLVSSAHANHLMLQKGQSMQAFHLWAPTTKGNTWSFQDKLTKRCRVPFKSNRPEMSIYPSLTWHPTVKLAITPRLGVSREPRKSKIAPHLFSYTFYRPFFKLETAFQ